MKSLLTCVKIMILGALTQFGTVAQAADPKSPIVVIDTNLGTIKVQLDGEKAPKTTDNFVKYSSKGHFDGTVFHRVIPGFMIQGGGMTADMKEKATDKPIRNESHNGLTNKRGTIAMARTSDPHSATAQFFINLKDNAFLDQGDGYAVFGKVIEGMDVVDKIAAVKTMTKRNNADVPVEPITIKSVKVLEDTP